MRFKSFQAGRPIRTSLTMFSLFPSCSASGIHLSCRLTLDGHGFQSGCCRSLSPSPHGVGSASRITQRSRCRRALCRHASGCPDRCGRSQLSTPVWESGKVWHDQIHVLTRTEDGHRWQDGGNLHHPIAYGANVSLPEGLVCMGGNDADEVFDDVFSSGGIPTPQALRPKPFPHCLGPVRMDRQPLSAGLSIWQVDKVA